MGRRTWSAVQVGEKKEKKGLSVNSDQGVGVSGVGRKQGSIRAGVIVAHRSHRRSHHLPLGTITPARTFPSSLSIAKSGLTQPSSPDLVKIIPRNPALPMLPQPALRCTSILILAEGVFIDDAPVERVEDGGGDERFYKEIEDRRR